MLQFLRDQAWGALGAVAALISLLLYILDKYSANRGAFYTRAFALPKEFMYLLFFTIYGLPIGIAGMTVAGILSTILTYFGVVAIHGDVGGDFLLLSTIKIWYFGFRSTMTPIELQLGAAGLYIGAFTGASIFGWLRITRGYDFDTLPNAYHAYVFICLLFVIFIGFTNIMLFH